MSFFDTILINSICVLFPILLYIIYIAYKNNNNTNIDNDIVFEIVLISALFLTFKFTNEKYNNYTIILMNIPLLFSYIRRKKYFSIVISLILIIYFYKVLNFNIYIIIFEYISYYILFITTNNKKTNMKTVINMFTIIKTFFFSFYIFNAYYNSGIIQVFNKIFICTLAFYICSNLYYLFLTKALEVVDLNNTLKELEKEKTLRNSLFKLTHEIKNPIAVCKGYLDMMDTKDEVKLIKYINIIRNEINRTLILMDDFLDYSKIKIEKNIMDINYLLEDTITSMDSLIKTSDIDLEIDIEDEEVYIDGDYNRLKQVVVNVIKNAIEVKRNKKKSKVSITARRNNNLFTIEISDNGVGMTEEELNNIGKAFYTTKKNGTGLGVLLSNEIIKLHNGKIKYNSKKNSGTTVNIVLPLTLEENIVNN